MCKQVSKVRGEFRICHKLLNSEAVWAREWNPHSQVHDVGWKVGGQETLFPVQSSSIAKQTWVVSSIVVLSVQSHKSLVKFVSQISNAIHWLPNGWFVPTSVLHVVCHEILTSFWEQVSVSVSGLRECSFQHAVYF
jgi:hypothetical protein